MKTFFSELWWFGIKQSWACLYGLLLLCMIALSTFMPDIGIARYDLLFLGALILQGSLMALKLETSEETKAIFLFHLVATVMELFKTSGAIGSWSYPEDNFFRIANVPLFTGFMYSAIGSYIARVWKIFELTFTNYPPFWNTVLLAALSYINFFTHHFWIDIRLGLFLYAGWIFKSCRIHFKITDRYYHVPLVLAAFIGSFFIWIAENIGTFFRVWVYPNQAHTWELVPIEKMSAWFLLMMVSFVLVSSLNKDKLYSKTP